MKKHIILSSLWICLLVSGTLFVSCDDPSGSSVVYPHRIPYVDYMGQKAGLTSSSTTLAFFNGLYETTISYLERQPITSNEFAFDGVVYGVANVQEILVTDIPQIIHQLCFEEFTKKYYKDVGSCYYLQCVEIPGKKETGRVYAFTLIISKVTGNSYDVIIGFALRGDVYPIR